MSGAHEQLQQHADDEYSVVEAARLIDGPGTLELLQHAIRSRVLKASKRISARERDGWLDSSFEDDGEPGERFQKKVATDPDDWGKPEPREVLLRRHVEAGGVIYRPELDWNLTTVRVGALREWLSARGVRSGYFFPGDAPAERSLDIPADLVPGHDAYSAKAAAVWHARREVAAAAAAGTLGPGTVKDALESWLKAHAAEFRLSGNAITECVAVANWKTKGGASKTPSVGKPRGA